MIQIIENQANINRKMKTLLLLLVLVSGSAFAQNNKLTGSDLVGKWIFSDLIDPAGETGAREIYKSFTMDFHADGTYAESFVFDVKGCWTFDPDNNEITTSETKWSDHLWHVVSLTPTKLVVTLEKMTRQIILIKT